ncbi:MAG: TorD/DmsD family molecular chaperone, partial [Planctomycetota bacterium]
MSAPATRPDIALFAQADLLLLAADLMTLPARGDEAACDVSAEALAELVEAAGAERASLLPALVAMVDEARRTDPALRRREHTRLFDGGVTCPVNETAYVRRDKGVIIGDICGFYRAFGFEPSNASGEKADHLICELEFTGVMLVLLGQAVRAGAAEKAEIVEQAVQSFLRDHLGEWLGLFGRRLMSTTELPLYQRGVDLLGAVWDLL